jgi:hypothetical protein
MVGGIVTQTIVLADKVWVDCEEPDSPSKSAIYVERNATSERIQPGDTVWWQGGYAMWTPYGTNGTRCGKDYDIKIRRIGFSGVKRPDHAH